jgi:hypothetical protein
MVATLNRPKTRPKAKAGRNAATKALTPQQGRGRGKDQAIVDASNHDPLKLWLLQKFKPTVGFRTNKHEWNSLLNTLNARDPLQGL